LYNGKHRQSSVVSRRGFDRVDFEEVADMYVINTRLLPKTRTSSLPVVVLRLFKRPLSKPPLDAMLS
jgi:hypothetical protein